MLSESRDSCTCTHTEIEQYTSFIYVVSGTYSSTSTPEVVLKVDRDVSAVKGHHGLDPDLARI